MVQSAEHGSRRSQTVVRYLPDRRAVVLAVVAAVGALLVATGGIVCAALLLPRPGWLALAYLGVSGAAALLGVRAARWAIILMRIRATVPTPLLDRRRHGDLDAVVADPGRRLRSTGMTPADVAFHTDALLSGLLQIPSVRIFQGVRLAGAVRPVAAHAVTAGRSLTLIESVAWPPGRYRIDATGRVRCDGLYIGQSAGPLTAAVHAFRQALPRGHRVSALVVVHRTGDGGYFLPAPTNDLAWALADDLLIDILARLGDSLTVSRHTVAALTVVPPRHVSTKVLPVAAGSFS